LFQFPKSGVQQASARCFAQNGVDVHAARAVCAQPHGRALVAA
jgi:hypothetical protein